MAWVYRYGVGNLTVQTKTSTRRISGLFFASQVFHWVLKPGTSLASFYFLKCWKQHVSGGCLGRGRGCSVEPRGGDFSLLNLLFVQYFSIFIFIFFNTFLFWIFTFLFFNTFQSSLSYYHNLTIIAGSDHKSRIPSPWRRARHPWCGRHIQRCGIFPFWIC